MANVNKSGRHRGEGWRREGAEIVLGSVGHSEDLLFPLRKRGDPGRA